MKASARLRAARELKKRGVRDVSRKIHYDPSYLSRVERGLQRPSVSFLLALARELDLDDIADALDLVIDEEHQEHR
jgi:transcriptional regulator with XRE-family HTH domain